MHDGTTPSQPDAPDADGLHPEASDVRAPVLFSNPAHVVLGWYWALPAHALRRGQVKGVQLLGRKLVLWRGEDGVARAADAHCPHMGAHLQEGRVDGNAIRCFFHGWRFDETGACDHVPCQDKVPDAAIRMWPLKERYGLLWVWPGETPTHDVPIAPELDRDDDGASVAWVHGTPFEKGCHPNVVMVNAIDEQHFTTVHHLPVKLHFDITEPKTENIRFENATKMPTTKWWQRFFGSFYADALTYKMSYWFGTNGTVTVGPDFQHFHIMFCLRPTADGKTEGQTVLVTDRRRGPLGWLYAKVLLFLTKIVGDYFADGDTKVFQTIRWKFQNPIAADRSIIRFIKHLEKQPSVAWGSWGLGDDDLVPLKRRAVAASTSAPATPESAA